MNVNIKPIFGNWDLGYAMDKHMIKSTYLGDNEYGRPQFHNERTEVGEALYQLKYQHDWNQVEPLAQCLFEKALPLFKGIQLIIPMAASNPRARQPVTAIAEVLASKMGFGMNCFDGLILKKAGGPSLKNLSTRAEKLEAVANMFSYQDLISYEGTYNALIIDDLYHTGVSMEAAVAALRGYSKIDIIYVAALTWKPE
ncbi:amidophosphoribosyltransferase [Erwinia typographi]|uniref:Amidophosphoribosyltransferase n=1 Tax=Erwinia typographi TaxID=371042 RepID=A0A0A3ZD92_9GAMM|nr:amidophosphoribosyltransferase [Erwinia typographi]KGT95784.1 amidophosphoribosyltransferase [Erwinia typographi]